MMKKLTVFCVAAVSVAVAAGIVEDTKSQPVLAGTAQIAPFGDVAKKVTVFGTMISNPIVPTLLLTSGQQQLVEKYGRFRADAPITWFAYIQTPAWEIAATNSDQVAIDDLFETALVYPSVDGPANMVLKHPGATKGTDGTIHLLPSEENPNDLYVKYTQNNRYCAIAASPALAERALADFVAQKAAVAQNGSLVTVNVTERGMTAMATLHAALKNEQQRGGATSETNSVDLKQKVVELQSARQKKVQDIMRAIASCTVTLDLDEKGMTMDTRLLPKPGEKKPFASDFTLPPGTLDRAPAAVPFFYFGGDRLLIQAMDEATFQADKAAVCALLPTFVAELAQNDGLKKYATFLKEMERMISQLIKDVPFPAATDWTGGWLGFDSAQHPYFGQMEYAAQAEEEHKLAGRFLDGFVAAVEKQWPGKGLLTRTADGLMFDWQALIDLCGAEAGVKPGDKEAKELSNAKKKVTTILGAGKLAASTVWDGNYARMFCAAPGIKVAEGQPTGEARVAVALPETVAKRPAAVFYLEPYSLMRESILPIMAKTSAKKDAQQYKTMIDAMTPAENNSALAYACWTDPNGSVRALLRITANELKNFGSAFNAFTAASLSDAEND